MFSTLVTEENKRRDAAATQKAEVAKLDLKLKGILMKQVTDLILDDFNNAGFVFYERPKPCHSSSSRWTAPAYMGVSKHGKLMIVQYKAEAQAASNYERKIEQNVPSILYGIANERFCLDQEELLEVVKLDNAGGYHYKVHLHFPNHSIRSSKAEYTLDPVEAVRLISESIASYVRQPEQ